MTEEQKMFIVAQDGSGDARTIQEAVDRAERDENGVIGILVRPGLYRERVVIGRDRVLLRGGDRDRTILTASFCAKDPDAEGHEKGTFLSFTLLTRCRSASAFWRKRSPRSA